MYKPWLVDGFSSHMLLQIAVILMAGSQPIVSLTPGPLSFIDAIQQIVFIFRSTDIQAIRQIMIVSGNILNIL